MSRVAFVFGSRCVSDSGLVGCSLARLLVGVGELRSGACRGADRLAASWARSRGLSVAEFPADWSFGPGAGLARSAVLVAGLPADAVCVCFVPSGVSFPGASAVRAAGGVRALLSAGSRFSVAELLRRGLPVWVVWACGRVTRCVPHTHNPQTPTRHDEDDIADTSVRELPEDGEQITDRRQRLTVVVNLRQEDGSVDFDLCDVYIGHSNKPGHGYFGNPFNRGTRAENVADYKLWFYEQLEQDAEFKAAVHKLAGLRLGCFCHPAPCHGHVIAAYLNGSEPTYGPPDPMNQSPEDPCAIDIEHNADPFRDRDYADGKGGRTHRPREGP